MLESLARWILKNKPFPQRQKQFMNWSEIRHILILAEREDIPKLKNFILQAEKDQKKVTVAFIVKEKPEQFQEPDISHIPIFKKQLSALRLPGENTISSLHQLQADILIDIGGKQNLSLLAISKLVQIKCKISSFENAIFDISISSGTSSSVEDFLKQVVVYLNMIKTTS